MRYFLGGIALALLVATTAVAADGHIIHSFERIQLTDLFFAEGANVGDINRDGMQDIIAGPYWYAGPDFTERFEIYSPSPFDVNGYSDNFFTFVHDVDRDRWPDVIVVGLPGEQAWWFANPRGEQTRWNRHLAFSSVDNESPTFTDLTGDGQPELVFHTGGRLGYAQINRDNPTHPWSFHAISPNLGYQRYTHGLGVGDVNGDGRLDLLEKNGWWEQPKDDAREQPWTFHAVQFAEAGGAQMFAYDVDGDGDNDVITSKAAHAYGLAWFENVPENGAPNFREHLIMGEHPEQNDYGVAFSQLHALALVDMDLDGINDIVTGKRFWAHQGHDPGGHDPVVSYWFKTDRTADGVRFIPYCIDRNSGVGTQVVVGDLNDDALPDVVVGNKKGTFALIQRTERQAADRHDAR